MLPTATRAAILSPALLSSVTHPSLLRYEHLLNVARQEPEVSWVPLEVLLAVGHGL